MLKNATYKEKCVRLADWMPTIITEVAKDLRNDHLKQDVQFVKKYFGNKPLNKLTSDELAVGYAKAMEQEEKSEEIAEFILSRWMLRNTEVYNFFESKLRQHYADFSEPTELDPQISSALMDGSIQEFGAPRTYLFSIINSVVFPETTYKQLQTRAKKDAEKQSADEKVQKEQLSVQKMQESYEQQIARLTDKYEKKLQGFQKKYLQDTETLKKQVSTLQRKLNEK